MSRRTLVPERSFDQHARPRASAAPAVAREPGSGIGYPVRMQSIARRASFLLGCCLGVLAHSCAQSSALAAAPPPAAAHAQAGAATPPPGFRALFDGHSLAGWWGAETENPRTYLALPAADFAAKREKSLADIRAHWRVENGELVNDGQGLYLTSEALFADGELWLEYKTVAQADSGVYLRACPQVQIWDTTEAGGKWKLGADKGSGGLWNNSEGAPGKDPLVKADRPFGEWNQLRIRMIGERVTVVLNGALVVDGARLENYYERGLPIPRSGPIQLQTHGGEIRWRNVWVREIGAEEANRWLAERDQRAAREAHAPAPLELFDGRDLSGWRGDVDSYEIAEGAIRCKHGHGGSLFTEREFGDFTLALEIQLPAGGNNGLAIRYPGEGDSAYTGMCELQVLDNEDPKYAKLDARQYHGSVYGQAAAQRGYLRAPGEWNYQRVDVHGSSIRVELNGTRILDADLAQIHEGMYPLEKFAGRMRTSGHFGFAGHDDPVAFRAIRVLAQGAELPR